MFSGLRNGVKALAARTENKISQYWARAGISIKLAVTISLLVLLPLMVFSYLILENWKTSAVEERHQMASQALFEVKARGENTAELCNLSTQVFLNTPNLIQHLERLDAGKTLTSQELLEFYRNDIASFERIVISNPYLYAIRVYSSQEQIDEMVPILYNRQRMENMEWNTGEEPVFGWHFDYTDTLFSYSSTDHIMGLITPLEGFGSKFLGVIEVAVRMDQQFPLLFEENASVRSCLILDDGQWYGTENAAGLVEMIEPSTEAVPVIQEMKLDGQMMLVSSIYIEEMKATYVQAESLEDVYHSIQRLWLVLCLVMTALFTGLFLGINWIVKNTLRQLYQVLEGVNRFSQGELDIEIPVKSEDEIGQFSRHVNGLLDNIRTLMQEQIRREVLMKSTEIHALQNQINAHFIYNVLEAIKMMAEIDEEYEIADAVTNLGQLLRYGMKWNRKTVTLWQEIDYVKNYIALMNLRYDWVTTLHLDISDKYINQELPKMSLQPIVENAVVHGASQKEQDSQITIRVTDKDGCCCIEIADDGVGLNAEQLLHIRRQIAGEEEARSRSGNGIGLKNVQERIQMTFGDQYGLEAFSEEGKGTLIRIVVPRCPDVDKEAKDEQGSDSGR